MDAEYLLSEVDAARKAGVRAIKKWQSDRIGTENYRRGWLLDRLFGTDGVDQVCELNRSCSSFIQYLATKSAIFEVNVRF